MVEERLKILLVDDDEDDYVLTRDLIAEIEGGGYDLEWVSTYEEAVAAIAQQRHDVYLFDYRLGEHDGLELLRHAIAEGCQAPIILLTGQGDREVDLAAMKAGAADFLTKGQLNAPLLERAIRYAVEHSREEQKLVHLVQCDLLTGLPNRSFFQKRLGQALSQALREERLVGLLFLDLDRFKTVNDTLGHAAGDELLKAAAQRLQQCLREYDTAGRMGGDEFVVLLSPLSDIQDAAPIAQRVLEVMAAPFRIVGEEVSISSSIGIAFFPHDGQDATTILKNADAAMYESKAAGGNAYRFFSREVNAQALARLTMERDLRRALERHEFLLHYQPQVDLETGRISGVEALLRWQPPEGELLPAAHFIAVLEESRLIIPVGEWGLRTACTQCMAWQEAGFAPLRMAVNISARQLQQPDFVDMVAGILQETGVAPDRLELEMTETDLLQNFRENTDKLHRLKGLGINLAIHNFRAVYLKDLPVDRIKVDRSFTCQLDSDPGSSGYARAIITLAGTLNLRVVAEGIETEEQTAFLRRNNCNEGQGFYFGRPASAEELARLLKREG